MNSSFDKFFEQCAIFGQSLGDSLTKYGIVTSVIGGLGIVLWPSEISTSERVSIILIVVCLILTLTSWRLSYKIARRPNTLPNIISVKNLGSTTTPKIIILTKNSDDYLPGGIVTLAVTKNGIETPMALCVLERINIKGLSQFKVIFVGRDEQANFANLILDLESMKEDISIFPSASILLLEEMNG